MDVFAQLQELSDYEEIQQLNQNYLEFIQVVHDALEAEAAGQVNSEDVDATIGQAIEDHAQNQLDIFDIEVEVEFEGDMGFGDALLELIDDSYEDQAEGIAEVASVGGVTPEEVQAYIADEAAPTPEVAQAIADHYLADDEEAYQGFLLLAQGAYQMAMGDMAMMSANTQDDPMRAEFSSITEERQVGFRLRQLEKLADQLEEKDILTPAERNSLLRSAEFRQDVDSVAVFSQFCHSSGVDPNTYLDQVEFCLNWKAQCGPSNYGAFFSAETTEPIEIDAKELPETKEFVTDFRSRYGYQ